MLVLSRKKNETIMVGNEIVITVLSISDEVIRLGISAPSDVPIRRQELPERIEQEERGGAA